MLGIYIKQATKNKKTFWVIGGIADLSFPKSKTRRGRTQYDGLICPTLMANNQELYVLESSDK